MSRKQQFVLYASLALNALVLGSALVMIGKRGGMSYLETKASDIVHNENRLDVFNASYRSQVGYFRALPASRGDIVFVGDSLTRGAEWGEMFEGKKIRNRGIGGDSLSGVLSRLDDVLATTPAKVFFMIGINDLSRGIATEELLSAYERILLRARALSPATEIYVQSILPVNHKLATLMLGKNMENVSNPAIVAINVRLRELAGRHGARYVDLYPLFEKEGELDPGYSIDGLHLNGAGYLLWKRQIAGLVG